MTSTAGRLVRLEERMPKGCATCRHWGPVAWAVGRDDAPPPRSETCPGCERRVPIEELRRIVLVGVTAADV